MNPNAQLDRVYREHFRDVLAPLVRLLGTFDRAEEAAQEAFVRAAESWPSNGMPAEPVAWLRRTARNIAIDRARRESRWSKKSEQLVVELSTTGATVMDTEAGMDDVLKLIFVCCHPSLAAEAQVALTLQTVCGLTAEEIARAFLVQRTTLQQRLARAKRKIDVAGIPFVVPEQAQLQARLSTVLRTIYLVFNEGYGATSGDELVRVDLCDEAIRLTRLLRELLPTQVEVLSLLALMLLQHSRRAARTDDQGELLTLEHQERRLWDRAAIEEALPMVEVALRARPIPPYAIQAAIAAVHARAERSEDTDWPQIVALYGELLRRSPGDPVVALNRWVAVAMAGDLVTALHNLDELEQRGALGRYHLLPAARAELLRRAGRLDEAATAYRRALELVGSAPERRFLERRLVEITGES